MADSQVDEFCNITGAPRERAEFFLKAAGGNLQTAMDAFYEVEREEDNEEDEPHPELQEPPSMMVGEGIDHKVSQPAGSKPAQSKKSGFATLFDYKPSSSERERDEDEGENFYAGGSEHSGQMISGPPRKRKDLAKEVFKAAKEQGAVPLEDLPDEGKKPTAFRGSGFRLGDSEGPSDVITGAPMVRKAGKVVHMLKFWKDGFSVDDGPLRNGQNPEDRAFIDSVTKGQIPMELIHAAQGGEVDINLEDRRNEVYVKPKPKVVAFSGEGHKLGNLTPEVHAEAPPPSSTTSSSLSSSSSASVPVTVTVDSSQPVTSIQIRLADGSRLQAKFNHSHTVGDVRKFIKDSCPEISSKPFLLLTTFPRKELTDDSQTLKDAQLLNAVVVQRLLQ